MDLKKKPEPLSDGQLLGIVAICASLCAFFVCVATGMVPQFKSYVFWTVYGIAAVFAVLGFFTIIEWESRGMR